MMKKAYLPLISILGIGAIAGGSYWYQSHKEDDPNAVTMTLNAIEPTNYSENPKVVYPMTIEFSDAAARIDLLKAELKQGASITPEIKGRWEWKSDRSLTFTPADDWPTGKTYSVKLDQSILNDKLDYAKAVTLAQQIVSPAFNANIQQQSFYQDPVQAHIRQSIVELSFSHPVDKEKLEKAIAVNLVRKNKDNTTETISPLNFKVRYSDNGLSAWVNSDSVGLAGSNNQYIQTTIQPSVTGYLGENTLTEPLKAEVAVPTKFSLRMNQNINYVNNQQNELDQLLRLSFNYPIKGSELEKHLQLFLLPKQEDGWSASKVRQEHLTEANRIKYQWVPTENTYAQEQNFQVNIPEQRCAYMVLDNEMVAQGGYQMEYPIGSLVCAGEYPKYVSFVGEGSLLALSGERKLTVLSRNLDRIRVDIGRVQGDQLRHIANLNRDSFQKPNLGNLRFDDIANFDTQVFDVFNSDPRRNHYQSIALDKLATDKGIFWLKVSEQKDEGQSSHKDTSQEYDWRNDELNQYSDYRLIVLTDLGIIAKKAADGSQAVFVQSIASGQPVAYAKVQVISRNGSVIEQRYTDTTGLVLFPNLDQYQQELMPVMYLVESEADQSFLPLSGERTLDYSRFEIDGYSTESDSAALKAYMFNDRGIYRPNEPVHIGMIVKAVDWSHNVSRIPLHAEIYSPSGKRMLEKTIQLNQSGLNSLSYDLPENAETGEWEVLLYINKQGEMIGSNTFQVQEFQPDTLKIRTRFNQQGSLAWVSPQNLEANVLLTNLFGTPAQDRQVNGMLALHSALPKFSEYPDYHFFDNQRDKSPVLYETELDEQRTNNQGEATFKFDLSQYATNTVQMLYFTADGFEGNSGRSVSTVQTVMVSAQPWLVGYTSKQDLAYLQQNSQAQAQLIAVNPNLEKIAVENLSATVMERKYVSVLTQQNSGAYKYESKLVETEKSKQPLMITADGIELVLDTANSGDYVVVISDQNDQVVNRIPYTVVGNQNLTTEMDRNSELKLRLNKKEYQKGEDIEIAIQAPYTGSGLITIETDRVYAHKWFKADTNQSVQRITLPENFEGSGYINVQFSRDLNSNDIFTSPLSYAVVPFSVNVGNHSLAMELVAPKQVKSGETVEFKLSANKPSKAIIYAVNEGILQVARYKQTEPLAFFFPKRALEVNTLQILDLILPEFSRIMQYAQTGGDSDMMEMFATAMVAKSHNPFQRRVEKPVAYWSDIVDVNGETTVSYRIPEHFNGNLKVMAIAVSNDSDNVGISQADTLVRNDLILSPAVPLTLTPSDQSQVSVNVSNNTKLNQQIKVVLTTDPQLVVVGDTEKTVEIAAMSEQLVTFEVKATELLGAANVRFSATYQDSHQQIATAERNMSLSVRPLMEKQHFTYIGKVSAGQSTTHTPSAALYPQERYQGALFSPVPLALAQGVSAYLSDYDNYCTEQIISAAMPTLLFADKPAYKPLLNMLSSTSKENLAQSSDKEINNALNKVFSLLPNRQFPDGSFGMWNNTEDSDIFLTAYVAHFLIEAQEHNVSVPRAWLSGSGLFNGTLYALEQQSMPQEGDSLATLRQRAYSAYLLARLGQVPSNALLSIRSQLNQNFKAEDWQSDLVSAWLAGTYQLVKQDQEANNLITPLIAKLNQARTTEWQFADFDDPMIQDSVALYVIARHFPAKLDSVSETVLSRISDDVNAQRYNTLSSAMMLLALDSYVQHNPNAVKDLTIHNAAGSVISSDCGGLFACTVLNDNGQIRFDNKSSGTAWFAVSQAGYPQTAAEKSISQGLEIHRTYTDDAGKEISEVKLGETINVTVVIRAPKGYQSDVVITDLFPAGFEAVWQKNGEEEDEVKLPIWLPTHTDLREDRLLNYGGVGSDSSALTYKLKAVSVGEYRIPAVYAESMYNRAIKAQFVPQGVIKVVQ
ncbi:alpha-2-macroglobulin [Glaesserella sp.]|uniref:alpha-2-macroglobulin family protein n=1 Tax=Glaesserella sp. TaxID=2094731 RepID=UPI00359F4DC3